MVHRERGRNNTSVPTRASAKDGRGRRPLLEYGDWMGLNSRIEAMGLGPLGIGSTGGVVVFVLILQESCAG